MTLTPDLTLELGLDIGEIRPMILADGSMVPFPHYYVDVIWDGNIRRVRASALDSFPTIGTSLLDGCELNIQFREGGRVLIQASA